MTSPRYTLSRRCPVCKQWLTLPPRKQHAFWVAHLRAEHPEDLALMQAVRRQLIGAES